MYHNDVVFFLNKARMPTNVQRYIYARLIKVNEKLSIEYGHPNFDSDQMHMHKKNKF